MTISNEVEVMDWAGSVRLVEEGKSVSWKTLGDTEEEQEDRQPDSEVILINVGTGIYQDRLSYFIQLIFDCSIMLLFRTVRSDQNWRFSQTTTVNTIHPIC